MHEHSVGSCPPPRATYSCPLCDALRRQSDHKQYAKRRKEGVSDVSGASRVRWQSHLKWVIELQLVAAEDADHHCHERQRGQAAVRGTEDRLAHVYTGLVPKRDGKRWRSARTVAEERGSAVSGTSGIHATYTIHALIRMADRLNKWSLPTACAARSPHTRCDATRRDAMLAASCEVKSTGE